MVSIVIISFNRKDSLERTLKSLVPFLTYCEIVVVDDGSTDGTSDLVSSKFKFVKLVRNPSNMGSAVSWNIGAGHATHETIFFMSDDTLPITKAADFIRQIPPEKSNLIIGVKVEGGHQAVGANLPDSVKSFLYHICGLVYPENGCVQRQATFVWGCMVVPKNLVELIPFDSSFEGSAFREETDFQLRARKMGYKILYTPNIVLLHDQKKVGGQYGKIGNRSDYWAIRNQMIFLKKHFRSWFLMGSVFLLFYIMVKPKPELMIAGFRDGWKRANRLQNSHPVHD